MTKPATSYVPRFSYKFGEITIKPVRPEDLHDDQYRIMFNVPRHGIAVPIFQHADATTAYAKAQYIRDAILHSPYPYLASNVFVALPYDE